MVGQDGEGAVPLLSHARSPRLSLLSLLYLNVMSDSSIEPKDGPSKDPSSVEEPPVSPTALATDSVELTDPTTNGSVEDAGSSYRAPDADTKYKIPMGTGAKIFWTCGIYLMVDLGRWCRIASPSKPSRAKLWGWRVVGLIPVFWPLVAWAVERTLARRQDRSLSLVPVTLMSLAVVILLMLPPGLLIPGFVVAAVGFASLQARWNRHSGGTYAGSRLRRILAGVVGVWTGLVALAVFLIVDGDSLESLNQYQVQPIDSLQSGPNGGFELTLRGDNWFVLPPGTVGDAGSALEAVKGKSEQNWLIVYAHNKSEELLSLSRSRLELIGPNANLGPVSQTMRWLPQAGEVPVPSLQQNITTRYDGHFTTLYFESEAGIFELIGWGKTPEP